MATTTTLANDITETRTEAKASKEKENGSFTERERRILYERIEGYPSVKRFLDKRGRNGNNTPMVYHTALTYLELFLERKHNGITINDMISILKRKENEEEFNAYLLIGDFVEFLISDLHKGIPSIKNCMKAIKGLLRSEMILFDVKMVSECASLPRAFTDESNDYALDKATISKILSSAKIRRLRVYLFALASSGTRVTELSSVRWRDIDFDSKPTTIHLRPETTKTRNGRLTFLSDEATQELKQWRIFKEQSYAKVAKHLDDNELVFLTHRHDVAEARRPLSSNITHQLQLSFVALMKELGLDKTKDTDKDTTTTTTNNREYSRHVITLHAFRKAYKSIISMAGFAEMSEYLIGHRSLSQTYFRVPPKEIARIYYEKLMPLLTFCDAPALENKVKSLEEKTEIINDLQLQMNKQANLIHDLTEGQTFANNMSEFYAQEQTIESLKKQIKDLTEMVVKNMNQK